MKRFLMITAILCVLMTACSQPAAPAVSDPDDVWKKGIALELPDEEIVLPYYKEFLDGTHFMIADEYEGLEMYASLHPEEYQQMRNPCLLRVPGSDSFIVYTDDQGNIKTTTGKTLGTIYEESPAVHAASE